MGLQDGSIVLGVMRLWTPVDMALYHYHHNLLMTEWTIVRDNDGVMEKGTKDGIVSSYQQISDLSVKHP